ncbi:unnamed protein product, partial [Symbiodinium sp. KB8]
DSTNSDIRFFVSENLSVLALNHWNRSYGNCSGASTFWLLDFTQAWVLMAKWKTSLTQVFERRDPVDIITTQMRPANPLCKCFGFRPEFVRTCLMHTVHLGIIQLFNGSVFTMLGELGWFGGETGMPEKMIILCSRFKQHSQSTMTAGMLTFEGGTYPSLNLKAYNGRLFLQYFNIVLRATLAAATDLESALAKELQLASSACTALCSFLDVMERSPRQLLPEQAEKMHSAVVLFVKLYQILVLHSHRRGTAPRWKVVPKFHSLLHVAEDQRKELINGRCYNTFLDEDYVGVFKLLCVQAPKNMLEFRCLTRYYLRVKAKR